MERQVGVVPRCDQRIAPRVRLVAPLRLLSQAVAVALRSRGFDVVTSARPARSSRHAEVMLLVDDLVSGEGVSSARRLIAASTGPVVVLTARERDRYWGALFAAGAAAVLGSTSTLDEVEAAIRGVANAPEAPAAVEAERERLIHDWEGFQREHEELSARLERLSPRELTVLNGLCGGVAVADLAELLGVAEATVRSQVKSILRKLEVRSQLAAVAVVRLLESPLMGTLALAHAGASVARDDTP